MPVSPAPGTLVGAGGAHSDPQEEEESWGGSEALPRYRHLEV